MVSLHIIGSGAADHDWENIGQPGVRGSACSLLNGHILLDAGVTSAYNLNRFGVNPDDLTDLLVTHTHIDHFDPQAIGKILAARSAEVPPLRIHCSPEGAAMLQECGLAGKVCDVSPTRPGDEFEIAGIKVTVLPSNHLIKERFAEDRGGYRRRSFS